MSLRYLTAGESHGKGLIGILEGMPAGLSIAPEDLQEQMLRRKMGYGRGNRMKIESDEVEIYAGLRHGKTLGSPIALVVHNRDYEHWRQIMRINPPDTPVAREVHVPRPGHADRVGGIKYAHRDMRNVLERSSARETAMRVALGTFARRLLQETGVTIASRVIAIGAVRDDSHLRIPIASINAAADASPVRCLDPSAGEKMVQTITSAREDGDTLGGVFEVYASALPIGLGSYAHWDRRLEAEVGRAILSLNAIKGVEIGLGFSGASRRGSDASDAFFPGNGDLKTTYRTNRSGGIDGGMSTGQPLVVRAAMKPLSTLMRPLDSVDLRTGEAAPAHIERSDTCAVPAAAVIAESLLALLIAHSVLKKFGGDSMEELLPRIQAWSQAAARR